MAQIYTDISRGSEGRIINLTSIPTEEAIRLANLCETVRINVVNLTPSQGLVTIPVHYCNDAYMLPIGYLEDVVQIGIATKAEFRLLKMMCDILKS